MILDGVEYLCLINIYSLNQQQQQQQQQGDSSGKHDKGSTSNDVFDDKKNVSYYFKQD